MDAVTDERVTDIPPPVPLPRVPVLTGDLVRAEPARDDSRVEPPRADPGTPRFSRPPVLEQEAAVVRVAIPGLDRPSVPRGKPMPLPTLDVPDRAPSPPRRLEPPPEPAVTPAPRERAASQPLVSPVEKPALSPGPHTAWWRQPARQAAGLTIHNLELQIVDRPRDVPPEPAQVATVAAERRASEWPDRRFLNRVW